MKCFLHAKIHKATVTKADVSYIGSITIDKNLLKKVGIMPGEKVLVTSNTTGARLETYVIKGGAGEVCMNGAAAHLIKAGEEVIIMAFEWSKKIIKSKIILVDKNNEFVKNL
ncbi:MAG: aspartate 1-decarboxylase [Patescibacteria group bacterium]|jgi:aspartate 1-decarboxylase